MRFLFRCWVLFVLFGCVRNVNRIDISNCTDVDNCLALSTREFFVSVGKSVKITLPSDANNYTFTLTDGGAVDVTNGVLQAPTTVGDLEIIVRRNDSSGTSRIVVHVVALPKAPTIVVAQAAFTTGRHYTASIDVERPGLVYEWSVTGAAISTAADGENIEFDAGASGAVVLFATATNEAGDSSPPGSHSVPIVAEPLDAPPLIVPTSVTEFKTGVFATVDSSATDVSYLWQIERDGVATDLSETGRSVELPIGGVGEMILRVRTLNQAGDASVQASEKSITIAARGLELVFGVLGGAGRANGAGSDARFNGIRDMASDGLGGAYVIEANNYAVRHIASDGTVTTIAGDLYDNTTSDTVGTVVAGPLARFQNPIALGQRDADHLYVVEARGAPGYFFRTLTRTGASWSVETIFVQSGSSCATSSIPEVTSIAVKTNGDIYVAGASVNGATIHRIYETTPGVYGSVLLAGDCADYGDDDGAEDGDGTDVLISQNVRLRRTPSDTIIFADSIDTSTPLKIKRLQSDGDVETLADFGCLTTPPALAMFDAQQIGSDLFGIFENNVVRVALADGLSCDDSKFHVAAGPALGSSVTSISDAATSPTGANAGLGKLKASTTDGISLLLGDYQNDEVRRIATPGAATPPVDHLAGRGRWNETAITADTPLANMAWPTFGAVNVTRDDRLLLVVSTTDSLLTEPVGQLVRIDGATVSWLAGRPDNPGGFDPLQGPGRVTRLHSVADVAEDEDHSLLILQKADGDTLLSKVTTAGLILTHASLPACGPGAMTQAEGGLIYVSTNGGTCQAINLFVPGTGLFPVIDLSSTGIEPRGIALDGSTVYFVHSSFRGDGQLYKSDIRDATTTAFTGTDPGTNCVPETSNFHVDRPCAEACFQYPNQLVRAPNGDLFFTDNQAIQRVSDPGGANCRVNTMTIDSGVDRGVLLGAQPRFNESFGLRLSRAGDLYVTDLAENALFLLRF